MMRKYLFIFLIIIANHTNSQIINTININGLNSIDRGTVLNYLPFEVGDFYLKKRQVEIHKALMGTGFFKKVIITDDAKNLNIKVVENPSIKVVDIKMKTSELIEVDKIKENLQNFEIVKGKIYNKIALQSFITQVTKVYTAGGYDNAVIDYKTDVDNDNLINITINITENAITKIKSMIIKGNDNFEAEELLDLFSIGEADNFIFNYFTQKNDFSQIALDTGLQKLTDFYLNNGYLDMTIDKVDQDKQNGIINIVINITEGQVYSISSINFIGSTIDKQRLQKLLNVNTGDVFKRKSLIAGMKNITNSYADDGYAFAKVELSTDKQINNGQHFINLSITIDAKQKVYVNRITIDGNTRTRDEVIRREIGVLEGGLYSHAELQDAIIKIKRLGFFGEVDMKVSQVPGSNDRINLNFLVTENKTGNFSVGISHSSRSNISFNTGIKERNIFGTGNVLNAQLSYSKAVQDISLFFVDNYLSVDGDSLSYGIFNRKTDGAELQSGNYDINKLGATIGYSIPFSKDSKLNTDLKVSKIRVKCGTTFALPEYEQKQCAVDRKNEVYTSIGYTINTLNNYNFPTKGKRTTISLGAATSLGDYNYYKFDINYRKYMPVVKKITFKIKMNLGLADGYNGQELPFFERYYAGGSSSVRGFNFNSLGVKYPDNRSKGGELLVLGGISIIAPPAWVQDSKSMRVSAFIDVGNTYTQKREFKADDLRAAVGLAFLWISPVGPLGLYIARPLKYQDGDDVRRFDFTLGTSF